MRILASALAGKRRRSNLVPDFTWAAERGALVLTLHLAESWERCPRVLYGHHCTWVLFLALKLRWPPVYFYCGWVCWDCPD